MFQPPKGTRDLNPEEMRKFQYVIDILRETFEKYGFEQIDTPAFEDFALLSKKSGESVKDDIYYFKDKSERELGLRFEFTASLARFMTNNPNIPKPFKRYQIGKVWRYDQPGAMRFREFWQGDVDIVGSKSAYADVQILACFVECLKKLGFKPNIRINSRLFAQKKFEENGIKNIKDVFRIVDKLDKIGYDGIKKELDEKGFDSEKIIKIIKNTKEQPDDIKELFKLAKKIGINKYLKFDFSLIRGLDYYTGLVFEVDIGQNVSVGGGGRYDSLIKNMDGPDLPAVGISFGIDRLVYSIKKFNFSDDKRYFIVPVNDKVRDKAFALYDKLLKSGKIVDIDIMNRKIGKQMEYASAKKFDYVIFVGDKELKKKKFKIKDMKTGKEKSFKI